MATYKVLVMGEAEVGKTALLQRVTGEAVSEVGEYVQTMGVDVRQGTAMYAETVRLEYWDCGGLRRFLPLSQQSYPGADVCILVYDTSSLASFEHLNFWYNEKMRELPEIPLIVVGAKADAESAVPIERGAQVAEAWGARHLLTSATSGAGVDDLNDALRTVLA
mmetsp:Transcript_2890/g.10527  ORF Transcript_2890/g.10527 Transcript_2890/m.10527 type:complete len:164 (-) Transcript_2890:4161-4652(-)